MIPRGWLTAVAVAASFAFVPSAGAAGELSYDGCLADDASDGCFDLPATPLTGASSVAVAPSGTVYATAAIANSILHFFAAPEGQISYDGCLADDASDGCFDLPATPLTGASSVAVASSGAVYATALSAEGSNSLLHFFAAPEGQISYDGCVANDASDGCADLPADPLLFPTSVAVAPNGAVYATGSGLLGPAGSILHFFAAPEGQISYDGCVANDASQGCADLPGDPLSNASSVAVSPGSQSVYVASFSSNSIATFSAAPQGQITFQGCLSDSGTPPCADLPGKPLSNASEVAVSPDGQSVYVASQLADSLSFFSRAPSGKLKYEGCLADNSNDSGCIDLPREPLDGAASIAVSPDGGSVYVASAVANSVAHFFRQTKGSGGGDKCARVKLTMTGSSKRDVLKGTQHRDVIAGLGGNDLIRGRGGNDLICGGPGKDKVVGGPGKDKLLGEEGKDKLVGGPGKDKLVGGPGKDSEKP